MERTLEKKYQFPEPSFSSWTLEPTSEIGVVGWILGECVEEYL
jgi:hypothetical protein